MIDVLLYIIYVMLGLVTGLTVWSGIHGLRCPGVDLEVQGEGRADRRRWIAWGTAGLLVVTLLLTFLFGSDQPLLINGQWFRDTFWLKLADMFILTTMVMLVLAVVGVVIESLKK
jgi:hypothetical protein